MFITWVRAYDPRVKRIHFIPLETFMSDEKFRYMTQEWAFRHAEMEPDAEARS